MWQDKLKEIIYILENSEVNEIEVHFWGRRYRVVKAPSPVVGQTAVPGNPGPVVDSHPAPAAPETEVVTEALAEVKSPMPGTFYRSPAPDAEPFVRSGEQVVKGDTLCIIEAMKIMNEIESEVNGTLKKILVENGQAVEYGQTLFLIKV